MWAVLLVKNSRDPVIEDTHTFWVLPPGAQPGSHSEYLRKKKKKMSLCFRQGRKKQPDLKQKDLNRNSSSKIYRRQVINSCLFTFTMLSLSAPSILPFSSFLVIYYSSFKIIIQASCRFCYILINVSLELFSVPLKNSLCTLKS